MAQAGQAAEQAAGEGYFLYHSIGQYPGKGAAMAAALAEFSARWAAPDDGQWPYALGLKQRFIALWAQLIGVAPATVTTCESVTAGLYSLIGGLPAEALRGRKLLVAGDCFPSLHFLLAGLQERFGFTLETVPLRPGAFWVEDEDVLAHWGPEVGLALLTWVTSTASHRCDVARLVAHGRAMGSLTGIDLTQGAGLLPFDAEEAGVDFALSTSLKWVCGAPGAGIIHAVPELIARCRPEFRGWFSQDNPFNWALDAFSYAPDMRRFDNGTPAVMAAAASIPALEWALEGAGARLAHNRALGARLLAGLAERGIELASPSQESRRGGSVMARLDGAGELVARLRAEGIHADARGPILRLSPGSVTTERGVERLLAALPRP